MKNQKKIIHNSTHLSLIAVCLFSTNLAQANGNQQIIARSGDSAFGAPAGALYSSFANPVLNKNVQLAYRGVLQTGAGGVTSSNREGIWRDNTLIARTGFQAADSPTGALYSAISSPVFNSNGQLAYNGLLQSGTGGVTSNNNSGIWLDNTLIAREGFQATGTPTGTLYSGFSTPALNNNGQLAYRGFLLSGSGGVTSNNNSGIWRDNTLIVREGFQASGTPAGSLYSSISSPVLNNSQLAYWALLQTGSAGVTTSNNQGIWLDNTLVARSGFQAAGTPTGALYSSLSNPILNNNGQVAYIAGLQLGAGGVTFDNKTGIWRDTRLIARKGSWAGGETVYSTFGSLFLNDKGQVAYVGTLKQGIGGVSSSNDIGIWRDNNLIARKGFQAAGSSAGALFSSFSNSSIALNNNGQLAYRASLRPGTGDVTFNNNEGIWITGSNNDTLQIIREGENLDGKTVSSLSFFATGFNDFSQLAYKANFTNGDEAVILYTPDLHWISSYNGNWDSDNSWTIAQAPGKVHDVFIDPSKNITVNGPSSERTVKHLQVGGGTGIGTLALNGGNLTALNGVNIASTGVLTGSGVITGMVTNQGDVRAQNVSINGGHLLNQGVIRGQTSGLNRLNARVENTASGEIELVNNESLRLTRGGHTNDGRVTVIGSRLTVDGSFNNNAEGRIQGRNALLEFNGGLTNAGQLQLSFGTSDIFGEITNSGSLVNSGGGNVTYYDDIKNNGEIRTSTGSQSVFFGDYSGTGVLTGSGDNQFEAGFSPGASPFMATSEGNVEFGFLNTTTIELAGSERGLGIFSEYDGLDVLDDKTLTLGGILDIVLIDDLAANYTPSLDDMFLIFTAGVIEGDFREINLPTLDLGLNWLVNNDGQNFSLTVAAVPLPAGVWLFVSALAGLLTMRRKV